MNKMITFAHFQKHLYLCIAIYSILLITPPSLYVHSNVVHAPHFNPRFLFTGNERCPASRRTWMNDFCPTITLDLLVTYEQWPIMKCVPNTVSIHDFITYSNALSPCSPFIYQLNHFPLQQRLLRNNPFYGQCLNSVHSLTLGKTWLQK